MRSVRSGLVALAARGVQTGLEVLAVMALARLLTPGDFGLVAMVLPVTILTNSLANVGPPAAALHSDSLDPNRLSSMFWMSLRLNGAIFGLMAVSGPALAWMYGDARVSAITALWALSLYGLSASGLHEALLKRQMRFGAVLSIQLGAQALGIAAAITAALLGAGYWALVLRYFLGDSAHSAATWAVSRWRPSRPATLTPAARKDVRVMLAYGWGWTGYRVVTWLGQQADRMLVGSLAGAGMLGLYHNARKWAFFPFFQVSTALHDVAISTFSRMRHDPDGYRRYWRGGLLPAALRIGRARLI